MVRHLFDNLVHDDTEMSLFDKAFIDFGLFGIDFEHIEQQIESKLREFKIWFVDTERDDANEAIDEAEVMWFLVDEFRDIDEGFLVVLPVFGEELLDCLLLEELHHD
jgi:hypothetical protein